MLGIILAIAFISALYIIYHCINILTKQYNYMSRLKRYISVEEIKEDKKHQNRKDFKAGLNIISRSVGKVKALDGYKKKVGVQLEKAHILLKPEEYISFCLILFFIFFLLGVAFTENATYARRVPFVIFAGVIGWVTPGIILKRRIKKRNKYLNEQLCDAVNMLSNSLKAGYSFFQAIDTVANEMSGPISEEFTILQKEISFGIPVENAMDNLVKRVCSDDLELLVTAVLIQRQVGGNLSEVLDNISSTIRDRIRLKAEVKTVTSQGRMSGLIISILPVALGGILFLINPGYIGLLFTNPIGIGILIYSAFMELIGIYCINRIVKIEL